MGRAGSCTACGPTSLHRIPDRGPSWSSVSTGRITIPASPAANYNTLMGSAAFKTAIITRALRVPTYSSHRHLARPRVLDQPRIRPRGSPHHLLIRSEPGGRQDAIFTIHPVRRPGRLADKSVRGAGDRNSSVREKMGEWGLKHACAIHSAGKGTKMLVFSAASTRPTSPSRPRHRRCVGPGALFGLRHGSLRRFFAVG